MSRFAVLGDQIAASLDVDDAILDGEVIAPDDTGGCTEVARLQSLEGGGGGQHSDQ